MRGPFRRRRRRRRVDSRHLQIHKRIIWHMFRVEDQDKHKIAELCQHYGVSRLDIFGSATGRLFDPERSDLDFIVSFESRDPQNLFDRYFGLREGLSQLFGREVDVLMEGAMKNPHFKRSVNEDRTPLYAA